MASEHELIIARCTAVGSAADPDYRQVLSCGRHQMLADERRAQGGADAGPMPFEYLLSALAACTSITLRMYAKRKGWEIGTVSVSASLRRGQDGDKVERRVTLSAPLSAEQHSRLQEICEKTPVTLAVRAGVPIHTTLSPAQPGPALNY